MIFAEHLGTACPVCDDIMTEHSNYRPVWSDDYDNIVCQHCLDTTRCRSCNATGAGIQNSICDGCQIELDNRRCDICGYKLDGYAVDEYRCGACHNDVNTIPCPVGIDANDPHTFVAGTGRLAFYDIMGKAGHYHEVCQECAHPMNEPVVDGGLELAPDLAIYSVWVGGGEINDYVLTARQAIDISHEWLNKGYDDVVIDVSYGSGTLELPPEYKVAILNWATSQANALTMAEYGGDYWNVWVSPCLKYRLDINISSHRDPDGDIARICAYQTYSDNDGYENTRHDEYAYIGTVDISHMR